MSSLKETLKSFSLRAGSAGCTIDTNNRVSISFTPTTSSPWTTFATFVAPFDCVCECYIYSNANGNTFSGFSIFVNGNPFAESNTYDASLARLCTVYQIKKGATISLEGENLDPNRQHHLRLYPTVGSQS